MSKSFLLDLNISAIEEENDWAQNILALILESHSSLLPCPSAKCRALKNEMDLKYMCAVDILFSSNHNIHKSLYDLCSWASDPLIDRFY